MGGFIFAAFTAAVVFCASVGPVFANSAPQREYGVTASGAIIRHSSSVLQVEKETLTFDVPDFPVGKTENYSSRFTAEYTFVNPSQETVHTSMAFPTGQLPYYMNDTFDYTPTITFDGKPVDAKIRHTYGAWESDYDVQAVKLYDDWYTDDFFNPDLPVYEYELSLDNVTETLKCKCALPADYSKSRFIGNKEGGELVEYLYNDDNAAKFYVLGEDCAQSMQWAVYKPTQVGAVSLDKKTDLQVNLNKTAEMTLKDLTLTYLEENTRVSPMDAYNAVVDGFYKQSAFADWAQSNKFYDSEFLTWYTYDVEFAPGQRAVNTVSASLFPDVNNRDDPVICEYNYYLSPAGEWASFGELTININTPYILQEQDGFTKTESGYTARYDSLPEGELRFELSTIEGAYERTATLGGVILIGIIIWFLITAMVKPVVGVTIVCVVNAKERKNR